MIKHLKRIVSFMLIMSFSISLIGCSKNATEQIQDKSPTPSEQSENATEEENVAEQIQDKFPTPFEQSENATEEENVADDVDKIVCEFIAGLKDVNFAQLQVLSAQDFIFRSFFPENIGNLINDPNNLTNSDNAFSFQLSSVAGFKKLSDSYIPLVFGILADDESMDAVYVTIDQVDMEKIKSNLNADILKGIELVQLFKADEQYLASNFPDMNAMSECRIAICSLNGNYFAVGFELVKSDGDFQIFSVWNAYDPNKSNTYQPYYKTKNLAEFASLKADEKSVSKEDLDKMMAQNVRVSNESYFENTYIKTKDGVYENSEDVIKAYIEAAKKNDVAAILATSAYSEISKGYDLNNFIERFGGFFPQIDHAMPKSDFYDSLLENHWLSKFAADSSLTLTFIISDESLLEDFDYNDPFFAIQLINGLNPKDLSNLEIVEIFSPMSNITNGDMAIEMFKKQAEPYGASDRCERIAIIKNGELYSIYPFSLYKYEDGWKIGDFVSHFTGVYTSATLYKTKDVTEFDGLK